MKNLIADINNPALGKLGNTNANSGINFFQKLIPSLIGLTFVVAAILFFFMLLFGAVQWMLSGGDKNALEAARGRISQALVGIIILFSVFAIIKLVEGFFGINILAIDIGPLIIK